MNVLRNFLITLRTYPVVALLNILGLGVAIAVAYMIAVQVHYEFAYNSGINDSDRIVKVEIRGNVGFKERDEWNSMLPLDVQSLLKEKCPMVKGVASCNFVPTKLHCEVGEKNLPVDFYFCKISREAPQFFGFDFLAGDSALNTGDDVFVSENFARKYNLSVGDRVAHNGFSGTFLSVYQHSFVKGIFKDFPANSDLGRISVVYPLETYPNEGGISYTESTYVKLREGFSPAEFDSVARAICLKEYPAQDFYFRSVPLDELYFSEKVDYSVGQGSLRDVFTLVVVAVVLIVIAFFNYLIFYLSLVPRRVRNFNIHKIMGASAGRLRVGFLCESVLFVVCSLFVAFFLVAAVDGSAASHMLIVPLGIGENISIVVSMLVAVLLLALAITVYPAYYATSFSAVFALNGNLGHHQFGRALRVVLLAFQFVASFTLVIYTMFIYSQNRYMINYDKGFDSSCVLTLDRPILLTNLSTHEELSDKLKALDGVVDVAYSDRLLVSSNNLGVEGRKIISADASASAPENVIFSVCKVSWNFLDLMGVKIYEGRDFVKEDCRSPVVEHFDHGVQIHIPDGGVICNEYMQRKYSLRLGDKLGDEYKVIRGFCRDVSFRTLQHEMSPHAFILATMVTAPYPYIKIAPNANIPTLVEGVRAALKEYSDDDYDIKILDDTLRKLYSAEQKKAEQVALFALIAIIVSLMGLFATVLFEVKYMEREIALRRVHGATVGSVLRLINIKYMRIVVASFVLAVPVAVYAVQQWLQQFAYKTTLHWYVFALAFMVVAAIAAAVVSFTAWHTANRNPVDVLKKE